MLTLIRCPFHPVLPQCHVKDPGRSSKSTGGRLHLNMETPLIQQSLTGLSLLSRHSGEPIKERSPHATSQGTLGHIRLSSLSHGGLILALKVGLVCARELISITKKKGKKAPEGNESLNLPLQPSQTSKKSRHHHHHRHHYHHLNVLFCIFCIL